METHGRGGSEGKSLTLPLILSKFTVQWAKNSTLPPNTPEFKTFTQLFPITSVRDWAKYCLLAFRMCLHWNLLTVPSQSDKSGIIIYIPRWEELFWNNWNFSLISASAHWVPLGFESQGISLFIVRKATTKPARSYSSEHSRGKPRVLEFHISKVNTCRQVYKFQLGINCLCPKANYPISFQKNSKSSRFTN